MIQLYKHMLPYLTIAQKTARESPCVRRQYGAVLVRPDIMYHMAACNSRVSQCCKGICARDRVQLRNGERVEVGAEVHAETAALIAYGREDVADSVLVLAGFSGERELLSPEVWPCHTCAMNLKFAGIRFAYMKNEQDILMPVAISEVLRYRESEWEPDV